MLQRLWPGLAHTATVFNIRHCLFLSDSQRSVTDEERGGRRGTQLGVNQQSRTAGIKPAREDDECASAKPIKRRNINF